MWEYRYPAVPTFRFDVDTTAIKDQCPLYAGHHMSAIGVWCAHSDGRGWCCWGRCRFIQNRQSWGWWQGRRNPRFWDRGWVYRVDVSFVLLVCTNVYQREKNDENYEAGDACRCSGQFQSFTRQAIRAERILAAAIPRNTHCQGAPAVSSTRAKIRACAPA